MFSFHKPKVYRSAQGCCICKAKSSSSRFTDSKKYELDFIECFQLDVPRQGEICNACVLLVKRFKRLPPDSDRNWGHVVDARVGPGLKSMTKFKKRKEEQLLQQQQLEHQQQLEERNNIKCTKAKSTTTTSAKSVRTGSCSPTSSTTSSDGVVSPLNLSDAEPDSVANLYCHESLSDDLVLPSSGAITTATIQFAPTAPSRPVSAANTQAVPAAVAVTLNRRILRKSARPVKNRRVNVGNDSTTAMLAASAVACADWTAVQTCCGLVYEHREIGAVIVDMAQWRHEHCVHHRPVGRSSEHDDQKQTTVSAGAAAATSSDDSRTAATTVERVDTTAATMTTTATPATTTTTATTIVSSAGRKIKLTSNAVQFLKKAAAGRATATVPAPATLVPAAAIAGPTAPQTAAAVQPTNGASLLGKIITIKTGSATVVSAVGGSVAAASDQGHKFNDNSSDSGYDEAMLQEPNGGVLQKSTPTIMRPLVLPKGIKLHVQSQKVSVAGIGSNVANQIVVLPLNQKLVQVNGKSALYNGAKLSLASAAAATTAPAGSTVQPATTRTRTRNH